MAAAFDPAALDGVLLLHRTFQIRGEAGRGDFNLDPWGTPRRRREREVAPFLFAGVQLATPGPVRHGPARAVQHQRAMGPRHRRRPAARHGA